MVQRLLHFQLCAIHYHNRIIPTFRKLHKYVVHIMGVTIRQITIKYMVANPFADYEVLFFFEALFIRAHSRRLQRKSGKGRL